MPPRKSMLGKRKNIPQPVPILSLVSARKRGLGTGSVRLKCPERVNLRHARRQLWSPTEELLTRNQKNENQGFGALKKSRKPPEDVHNTTAEDFKENAAFRFQFNSLASNTKGNTRLQCSQHVTPKTVVSSDRVAPSRFGYTASIPDAPVLLKSKRSQTFRSRLPTKSGESSDPFTAYGSGATGTSRICKLGSGRSQRLADPSSQLSVHFKELGRSQRHGTFVNQLSTESDELGKVRPASNSKRAEIGDVCRFIEHNKSQRMSRSTVESGNYPGCGAIGALGSIRFLGSQKLETSAAQSKSEECDKVAPPSAGTNSLSKPFLWRSDESTRILEVSSQNQLECHERGKALADNHREMETECGSAVLMPTQSQSDGSRTQPQTTDVADVAAEASGTATPVLSKSRIPQRVAGRVCESIKGFKECDSTSSFLPATNKPCYGVPSRGSFLTGEERFGSLYAGHCDEPFGHPKKSRLSPVEQTVAPVCSASTNLHTLPTIIEPREHYNVSAPYSGRINAECLQMKTEQSPRVSGISGSVPMGTMVTRSKRKRSLEESVDANICTTSDSPLKQGYEENCGKPNSHIESSLSHNVAASRLMEKPLEQNVHVELKIPSTAKTYRPLNIANDVISTDELQYHVESKVSLMRKPPGVSTNDTSCMQSSANGSPMPQNPSMLVLPVPRNTPLNETYSVASRDTFTVSVATQTDDNVICVKSAVAKVLPKIQAIQQQTNVISNEIMSILNDELSGELFREGNSHSSDAEPGCSYKNSEECQASRPLRRSEKIVAQKSVTFAGDRTFCDSKSAPATPVHLKPHDCPNERSQATKLKSVNVYKDLRTSFHFLRTPQSTRRPNARTPKNSPTRILSERLQNQILSLYD